MENGKPFDIFLAQIKEIMDKRANVKKLAEYRTENKYCTINSRLYSAEKDGMKNHYYCNLVELKEEPGDFAWVLCTAIPSYAKKNMAMLDKIVASARKSAAE